MTDLKKSFLSLIFSNKTPSPTPAHAKIKGMKMERLRLITKTEEPMKRIKNKTGADEVTVTSGNLFSKKRSPNKKSTKPIPGKGI
jgi:hypothetical protein